MFQSNKLNNNISSILGPELKINGDIDVNGDLLIYGQVNGNITCKGTLHSAKGSTVKGNINSKDEELNFKSTYYEFRNTLGDDRKWGVPLHIIIKPARNLKEIFVVKGESIQGEINKFLYDII